MRVPFETAFRQRATGRSRHPVHTPSSGGGQATPLWLDEIIRERRTAGDRITYGLGVALAITSATFAIYTLGGSIPGPRPSPASAAAVTAQTQAAARDRDPISTGSVAGRRETGPEAKTFARPAH